MSPVFTEVEGAAPPSFKVGGGGKLPPCPRFPRPCKNSYIMDFNGPTNKCSAQTIYKPIPVVETCNSTSSYVFLQLRSCHLWWLDICSAGAFLFIYFRTIAPTMTAINAEVKPPLRIAPSMTSFWSRHGSWSPAPTSCFLLWVAPSNDIILVTARIPASHPSQLFTLSSIVDARAFFTGSHSVTSLFTVRSAGKQRPRG